MNLNEIQDLIKFVAKCGVTEVEIEKEGFKITIKSDKKSKEDQQPLIIQAAPQMPVTMPQAPIAVAPPVAPTPAPAPVQTPAAPTEADDSKYITIKSPMPGTFYRSSSPDKDPFVQVGTSVNKGETVCIIEAMKLFNEIEAEFSGKVVKVLVDDASPVEYDQPLFLVDPA